MIEQTIRQPYQKIAVDPVARLLSDRFSPNTITWLSGGLGVFVLPALMFNHPILALIVLLMSGYCDTLDGTLARLTNKATAWGSVLDITMDRLVEFWVVLALFWVDPTQRGVWCIFMLGSMMLCITSFLVVGIFVPNTSHKSFHYSRGLMERAEAFIFFAAMIIWPEYFHVLACLFIFLVTLTGVIRLYQFYQYHRL